MEHIKTGNWKTLDYIGFTICICMYMLKECWSKSVYPSIHPLHIYKYQIGKTASFLTGWLFELHGSQLRIQDVTEVKIINYTFDYNFQVSYTWKS